ncbi:hypothetical protein HMPREF1049_0531 [Fusobacterium necrophorum subsp. funduliforme ATCC 51357]|nr:hypothetical protein HMPREF1049_0531 [Fusobacterium necrophorum subsp. funduliforme ATCC 51357]
MIIRKNKNGTDYQIYMYEFKRISDLERRERFFYTKIFPNFL